MTAREARTHIRYTGWASRRLLEAIAKLNEEQRNRDLTVAYRDIAGTLAHVYMADATWFSRMVDPAVKMELDEGPRHEVLARQWPELQKRWEAWADSLTDPDMVRVISYKNLKGEPFTSQVSEIVMHVVNHGTLHRGQVMSMLRQLGAKCPSTDLMTFYRERK